MRQRRAIRAIARHCIVDVGHGQDPDQERDCVALEPVGITPPIEPLVVPANQGDHVVERLERLDDLDALDGMLRDDPHLVLTQFARLVEDGVGNADLADVVEQASTPEDIFFRCREPELACEGQHILGDALGVSLGVRTFRLGRAGEGEDDGLAGLEADDS